MNNKIGNLSTIVKFVSLTFAGYLFATLTAQGLDLPFDAEVLSQLISTLLFFALAYIDAKYPNSFGWLDNVPIEEPVETEEDLVNEEYYEEV